MREKNRQRSVSLPRERTFVTRVHESAKDYFEEILMLREGNGHVRPVEVANAMGYSKPSISITMKHPHENRLVRIDIENFVYLIEEGEVTVNRIYDRYRALTQLLVKPGVPSDIAERGTYKVGHDLNPESFTTLKEYSKRL